MTRASKKNGASVLRTVENAVRRLGIPFPDPLRRLARKVNSRLLPGSDGLADWTVSLVGQHPLDLDLLASDAAASPQCAPVAPAPVLSRDRPRCLVVTPALDAGGLDTFVRDQAEQFTSWGVPVAVAHTLSPDIPLHGRRLADQLRARGIEVVDLSPDNAMEWIRRWRPNVIAAHGAQDWVLETAERLEIPVVETLHGPFGMFMGEEEAMRARSAKISAFVCVSEEVRRRLLVICPDLPPGTASTIPNGVPRRSRPAASRSEIRRKIGLQDEFLVVSMSRFCLQKNAFGLAAAFLDASREQPNMHLLIAGRADDLAYTSQVLSLRDASTQAGQLHLRQNVAHPDLILHAADAFALDSFFEGWSLASTEAAIHGLPMVLSEVAGAREVLGMSPDDPLGPGPGGVLTPHPLGDPGMLDWRSMASIRYARQPSHEDVVRGLVNVAERREYWETTRSERASENADRFRLDACLAAHLEILAAHSS